MATVINNPSGTTERTERYVETDTGAGWAVAVIVLLAVIVVGAYLWYHYRAPAANTTAPGASTNVQVTLPAAGNTQGTGATQSTPAPRATSQ